VLSVVNKSKLNKKEAEFTASLSILYFKTIAFTICLDYTGFSLFGASVAYAMFHA